MGACFRSFPETLEPDQQLVQIITFGKEGSNLPFAQILRRHCNAFGPKYLAYLISRITRMAFGKAIQVIKALLGSFWRHKFYKTCNKRTSLITIGLSQNQVVSL